MAKKTEVNNENDVADKSVFIFFPATDELERVLKSKTLLSKLVVVGQDIDSLTGIEELKNLEELWIVECNLQQENVEPISRCVGLKRLYLYNNNLTAIPNLENLCKLSHLWLSDNKLESCQGINSLSYTKELCLSNNNIDTLDVRFKTTLKIVFLNLAGNPIKNIKEIQKLESLHSLRWLVLSDPLFRTSPVSLLTNFRSMVIHCLPGLEKLDMLHISQNERTKTAKFFDAKLEYYRLSMHCSLAKLCESEKKTIDLEIKELEVIQNALKSYCSSLKKDEHSKSNNLRFWEGEGRRWNEKLKLLHLKFSKMRQVITEAVNLEVESCGNMKFLEVDLTDKSSLEEMKNIINSFVCSHLKGNVLELSLQNAWFIQGHHETTVLQSQFQHCLEQLYIVTKVQDLGTQPLKIVDEILFGKPGRELVVTKCLVLADPLVSEETALHRALLLRSQSLQETRLMVVCGVKEPQLSVYETCSHGCEQWVSYDLSELVPLYLLHFQYIFQDYFKPLKTMSEAGTDMKTTPVPLLLPVVSSQHVTELLLPGANLSKIDLPVMEHVTWLDLSYNQLKDISSVGSLFPKLATLNVDFNQITSLSSVQGLKNIKHLTMSWNLLSDFLCTLTSLKSLSSLKNLDLSYNPFRDVTLYLHQQFFVCKHLKSLTTFNEQLLSRSLLHGEVTLGGQEQFPVVAACKSRRSMFSIRWKTELSDTPSDNHIGVIKNQVTSIRVKSLKIAQFRSAFSLGKLKWLDLTDNLIAGSSTLKALSTLEEVNLSQNVIEGFTCPNDRFKHLTNLDLSHNYISSLTGLTCQGFPQIKILNLSNNKLQSLQGLSGMKTLTELYVSHNNLEDPNTLENCKDMKKLKILDVSYNPLVEKDFRTICLHYVNALKYINGKKVQEAEAKSVKALYEGLLDQDYLIQANKSAMINSLSQLSFSHCNIKKVHLPNLTLPNVNSLVLDHNKITTLSWVQTFVGLTRLSLSHNRVSSCGGPSSPLLSLKSLKLDHNRIKNISSIKLDLFPNLQLLVLNNNEISLVTGLKHNCQLEHLMLDKNKVFSISADQMAQLGKLTELYLEYNSLTRLDFVRPLRKLRKLFIGHNKIVSRSCLEPLSELPNLTELTIHGNPVFRTSKSYRDFLPDVPSLQLLEGHSVNKANKSQ